MDFENLVTKVVVVTYGERWPLLKKTLDSIMKHKRIDEVIIVQNGLEYDLQSKISSFPKLKLIINEKNEGSAGGFYVGLKYLKNKSEHNFNVLIMDDDNIIDDNAFKALNCAEHLDLKFKVIWHSRKNLKRPLTLSSTQLMDLHYYMFCLKTTK